MKKITAIIISVIISGNLLSQKIANGGYNSYEEFKNNKPTYADSFIVKKRTTGDIKAWGGNDYKVEYLSESVTKKMIKKEIWGISKNDTLYLNAEPLSGLYWYARVEIVGKYCFVRPALPINGKLQKQYGLNDPQFGYMFGALGGALQAMQTAVKRIPVIYCPETGDKMLLSETNLTKLMENNTGLLAEFNAETDKNNEEVLLKYLKKLNDVDKR